MTTIHTESETKFEGSGVFDPDGLRRLPSVARVREERPEELDAVYYDTADLRLLAHGITLRRRSGGHDEGWHVKLPAEGGDRHEIHAPLRAGAAGRIPAELDRYVKAYTRGAELVPVVHLRTHRRRHLLLDKKNRCLAEVAQDRVAAQVLGTERLHPAGTGRGSAARTTRPVGTNGAGANGARRSGAGTSTGSGTASGPGRERLLPPSNGRGSGAADGTQPAGTSTQLTHWSEVEVEKDHGDDKLMRAAARWLKEGGWSPSASAHKLDHALADALPPEFGDPEPGHRPRPGSAGEAVMNRLAAQLDVLLACDAAVRADEDDAVHLMRSTSRRLRNLLRSSRRVLDRRRTDPVAGELRWLTGVLGGSRDHEVLAARLRRHARGLAQPADGQLVRRIAGQEAARHAEAHRAAIGALDSPRYHALLDALESLRAEPPLRPGRAGKPAVEQLRKAVARDRRRLARRMAAAEQASRGPARDKALHEARKAARRARHTAETALPYGGRKADRFRKRAKAVQQVLGEHQDAVMTRAALPQLAAEAHAAGADTYGYGRLHAHQDHLAHEARHQLPAAWRRLRGVGIRFS